MGSLFGVIRKYKFFVFTTALALISIALQLGGVLNMAAAIVLGGIAFVLLVIGILGFTSPKATKKIGGFGKTPMKLWPKRKANQALLAMLQEQGKLPSQVNGTQITVLPDPKPELKPIIHDYELDWAGGQGYPPKRSEDDKALWLRLGVTFKVNQNMRIETLYLLLSGDSIQPEGNEPYGYYIYFEMPQQVKSGDIRTIQLVASAKGKKWGSDPKEIRISSP